MNAPISNDLLARLPRASILATGSYVPERVLTNADLEKMVDTTDEWIMTRTGIRERHIARTDEATSDMATEAARRALAAAGVAPEELDMIIVATITPDMGFPNTACFVQSNIGAVNAFCYDIEAACSGFVYGLDLARQYIATGSAKTILLIGAEKISCITDWTDRSLCVLFGDGAGAAVLRAEPNRKGILSAVMRSDGRLHDLLKLPGGGSRNPASAETLAGGLHFMKMNGRDVFKHAVTCMTDVARKALDQAGLTVEDVKLIIPHQANLRIVSAIGERLGGKPEQYFVNLDRYGNTSAASVILALDEAVRMGKLERGDRVLLVAFGGGFTWGASVLEW
ncbi:MAG: ketoacyl-ACP synthase III [Kiritimatiellae bacterium]|nr:ketoacyl-ACP synthase III [Kiritimatiellia bacterium]MCO5062021.1 ketoacyl-ACP synthase III [Kiritimatiellia bacterium]MCO5069288.1 ketoacyl-ACP synthase III [Kiritimatiellia bacterium]MCO6400252.1 ketoacyl-ACP synthase III [Verrucomicrobiota bacterium]